ncbi:uncharacterized protein N7496_001425 [Penicillium cataractarum]|uniref:DNA-directed RNA polymerase III subunit RPC9 n=1 Tax=Penicillium cataractarum TaxID=2100454 RepID=A0A9W9VVU4_9EURO|nr:uncharacterized protein N7496_001425 [Penicillium cataractarum]KAJ5390357.1 hypothetical protein N7496_001425 [Penicillium cataractarum]
MKILDPQAAVLTNVEVLAYLTANPPRRPPSRPPNARQWVPSPDLRDHNTVVKEFHNYVTRISPHLLKYPRYTDRPSSSHSQTQAAMTRTMRPNAPTEETTSTPHQPTNESTPMDRAMRDLILKLRPYGLTKAEVLTIINLGIGLSAGESEDQTGEANGEGVMDLDEDPAVNGEGEEGEEAEEGEGDFGALALFDAVIEEREYRISNEDFVAILEIIRETLAENYRG